MTLAKIWKGRTPFNTLACVSRRQESEGGLQMEKNPEKRKRFEKHISISNAIGKMFMRLQQVRLLCVSLLVFRPSLFFSRHAYATMRSVLAKCSLKFMTLARGIDLFRLPPISFFLHSYATRESVSNAFYAFYASRFGCFLWAYMWSTFLLCSSATTRPRTAETLQTSTYSPRSRAH